MFAEFIEGSKKFAKTYGIVGLMHRTARYFLLEHASSFQEINKTKH
jgi:hypothetical protein